MLEVLLILSILLHLGAEEGLGRDVFELLLHLGRREEGWREGGCGVTSRAPCAHLVLLRWP